MFASKDESSTKNGGFQVERDFNSKTIENVFLELGLCEELLRGTEVQSSEEVAQTVSTIGSGPW